MKSLSTNYKAHVALPSTTLASIIKIVRKDTTTYLYTDHDQPITFGGETYSPLNSFIPTDFQTSATLAVDNLDITGIINESEGISEIDIHKEFFYDAKIYVSQVDYTDPDGTGQNKILYGSLGELSLQENKYIVEFRSLTYPLTRKLANVFSKTCRVEFGSTKCGIVVDPGYWQDNTLYCVGDVVQSRIYDGNRYVVTTGGTSSTSTNSGYAAYLRNDTNLTNQWSLDEDSDAASVVTLMHCDGADTSTTFTEETGKTVTVVGDTQIKTAQSQFGGASGYFDGTGDYLHMPTSTDWNWTGTTYTAECWINLSSYASTASWRTIFAWHVGSTGWRLLVGDTGQFHLATDAGGLGGFHVASAISLNTWHHIAMVVQADTVPLAFVDGVLINTGTAVSFTAPTSTTFKIGSTDGSNFMWHGYIDEIRITKGVARYTSDFTVSSVPFSINTLAEDTEGANDGTYTNTPTLGVPAIVENSGTAVSFDRPSGEYVSVAAAAAINNLFSAGSKTVELWFKPTGLNGDGADSGWLVSKDDATGVYGTGRQGWGIQYFGDTGRIQFFQRFDDGVSTISIGIWITAENSIVDNTIYHLVVVYDGSATTNDPIIYLNGVSQSITENNTPTGGHTASSDSSSPLTIGTCDPNSTTRYFDGVIDEVALYSNALSAADIVDHYLLGKYGVIEPTWDTTIGNTTADNTIVWTTNDGYRKETTILAPTKIRLRILEADSTAQFQLDEVEFYDETETRIVASSVAGVQYFANSPPSETNNDPGEMYLITNGTDEAILTYTFSTPFILKRIDITGIAANSWWEGLIVEVSYDNETTWEEVYSFTGGNGNKAYFSALGGNFAVSQSEINSPSRARILIDITTFSNMKWIVDGVITWVDGYNSGLSIEVSGYNTTTGEIYLFSPMPEEIGFGDNIVILSGCNHLYLGSDGTVATGHCETRYSNGANFRGEPFVPTEDVLVGGIGETNKAPIIDT